MRVALVNPRWTFDGSIYFGCREPHLPYEFGCARALLEAGGHEATIIDGHLFDLDDGDVVAEVRAFRPDIIVITTAPTYLFWRCAPPELRVPRHLAYLLRDEAPLLVAVGPHGSTTPAAAMAKLPVDAIVMGECEETLARLASGSFHDLPGLCYRDGGELRINGGPQATAFKDLPVIRWPAEWIARHHHHHHRFDAAPAGPGAEVEASRGCPYHCSFCAKENFRDIYRRRPAEVVAAEVEALAAQGAEYVYFIDEIFLPDARLLELLVGLGIRFGVQTRIDLWKPEMLELLGRAGCVSIEAGVESLTAEGRAALLKQCRMSTEDLADRLITAKRHVPFVQANLIETADDDPELIARWRARLQAHGVWANDPVPLFPYPGSPDYRRLWGPPDAQAWERALDYYLDSYSDYSDIQDARPLRLAELEGEGR